MDITNFINWFIDQIIYIMRSMWNILASIQFSGTNLLLLKINLLLLAIIIPVILEIGKARPVGSQKYGRKEKKVGTKHER